MLYFLVITDLHTGTLPSLKPAPIDSTLGIYVGNFVICNVLYLICSCEIIIKINFPLSSNITELHTPAAPCNVSPSVNPVSNLTSVSDHDWVVIDAWSCTFL